MGRSWGYPAGCSKANHRLDGARARECEYEPSTVFNRVDVFFGVHLQLRRSLTSLQHITADGLLLLHEHAHLAHAAAAVAVGVVPLEAAVRRDRELVAARVDAVIGGGTAAVFSLSFRRRPVQNRQILF